MFDETKKEITVEVKGVDGILNWLVRPTEAEKIRRKHPGSSIQQHRNHLAIEIAPRRLTMQAEKGPLRVL